MKINKYGSVTIEKNTATINSFDIDDKYEESADPDYHKNFTKRLFILRLAMEELTELIKMEKEKIKEAEAQLYLEKSKIVTRYNDGDAINETEYKTLTGQDPQHDDLERVNCPLHGNAGHHGCGICDDHRKPRFLCGCLEFKR